MERTYPRRWLSVLILSVLAMSCRSEPPVVVCPNGSGNSGQNSNGNSHSADDQNQADGAAGKTAVAVGGKGGSTHGASAAGAGASSDEATTSDSDSADPCGPEASPNDTRDTPTSYTPGTDYVGCIGTNSDVDFYEVTAPQADAAGGYYAASITNVGANGIVEIDIYEDRDNARLFQRYSETAGASLGFYFATTPGEKYLISVLDNKGTSKPYQYTLHMDYTKIDDMYEPNDDREHAKPVKLNTPVQAYYSAGLRDAMAGDSDWQDWYSLTLDKSATVSVKLTSVPTNIKPTINIYDPDGTEVGSGDYEVTGGSAAGFSHAVSVSGVYTLRVAIFANTPARVGGSTTVGEVADNLTRPYMLTITQP